MDPFVVLGVRRDASAEEIRRAFADGVRAAHPDVGGSPAAASDRLAALIRARDVALNGPPASASLGARVEFYQRAQGLERLVRLVVSALPWGRPKRPGRNLE